MRYSVGHLEGDLAPDDNTARWIAEHTDGFSFAFLKELCIAILLELASNDEATVRSAATRHVESLRTQIASTSEAISVKEPPPDAGAA